MGAYYQCRQRKRRTTNAAEFEIVFESELLKLERELKNGTYRPGKSICFVVTNPKIREVFAADFRDRVVHHLLINYLEPIFEKKFIFHSFACRKEKGAIRAMEHLRKKLKPPGGSRGSHPVASLAFLKIDIRAFFMSLDKSILFEILKKHIRNPEILRLAEKIIFHKPTENFSKKGQLKLFDQVPAEKSLFKIPPGKGLPIGNLTSQFFANVYLNELDQFAKHTLKTKYYFRYVDDIVILHSDQAQLKFWRKEIDKFLREKLKLELHPQKDVLRPVSQGIDFLGYIVKPDRVLVRNRTVRAFKNKLWRFNQKMLFEFPDQPNYLWTPELREQFREIFSIINSYYGIFSHADTFRLRRHLWEKHFNILRLYLRPANKNFDYFVWAED